MKFQRIRWNKQSHGVWIRDIWTEYIPDIPVDPCIRGDQMTGINFYQDYREKEKKDLKLFRDPRIQFR